MKLAILLWSSKKTHDSSLVTLESGLAMFNLRQKEITTSVKYTLST